MKQNQKKEDKSITDNKQWQGNDKWPADEKNKGEKVTKNDLKNKTVDADPGKKNSKN